MKASKARLQESVDSLLETLPPVLEDIRLNAESGQMIAILGATGSGKSSLIDLTRRCCMDADLRKVKQGEGPSTPPDILSHEVIRDNGWSWADQRSIRLSTATAMADSVS